MNSRTFATGVAVLSVAALIAALVAVLATSQADAARRAPKLTSAVLRDCSNSPDGLLQHRYSAHVLRRALKRITGDIDEYTGCREAVRYQLRLSKTIVVAGIRGRRGGPLRAGRIALRHKGQTVDVRTVRPGGRATFRVMRGTYTLRADGRRRCTTRVVSGRPASVSVICRR